MKRLLVFLVASIIGVSLAYAQNPVVTRPYGATISNASSIIISTNIFQSIFPASTTTTGRVDCIIQNLDLANDMYLHFGPIVGALTINSLTLAAGSNPYYCNNNGVVIKDQISITGIISNNFFAIQE